MLDSWGKRLFVGFVLVMGVVALCIECHDEYQRRASSKKAADATPAPAT